MSSTLSSASGYVSWRTWSQWRNWWLLQFRSSMGLALNGSLSTVRFFLTVFVIGFNILVINLLCSLFLLYRIYLSSGGSLSRLSLSAPLLSGWSLLRLWWRTFGLLLQIPGHILTVLCWADFNCLKTSYKLRISWSFFTIYLFLKCLLWMCIKFRVEIEPSFTRWHLRFFNSCALIQTLTLSFWLILFGLQPLW